MTTTTSTRKRINSNLCCKVRRDGNGKVYYFNPNNPQYKMNRSQLKVYDGVTEKIKQNEERWAELFSAFTGQLLIHLPFPGNKD